MAPSRGRVAVGPKPAAKKNDSSKRRLPHAVAEESPFFGAQKARVTVGGTVPGWTVPRLELLKLLKAYLLALGLPDASLDLHLVGDDESRHLNRRFRRLDVPTDVLSFPAEAAVSPGFRGYLGELALDLPYAWRKRGRFHPRFEGEAAFLLLHGLLHLSGVHHDTPAQERALWRLQDRHFPPAPALLAGLRGLRPKA